MSNGLGHAFKFLSHGLVHKEETGMGATTLELKANRNSIIVEPIKIKASSKPFIIVNLLIKLCFI